MKNFGPSNAWYHMDRHGGSHRPGSELPARRTSVPRSSGLAGPEASSRRSEDTHSEHRGRARSGVWAFEMPRGFPAGFELWSRHAPPPKTVILNYENPMLTRIESGRDVGGKVGSQDIICPVFLSLAEGLRTKSPLRDCCSLADKSAVI